MGSKTLVRLAAILTLCLSGSAVVHADEQVRAAQKMLSAAGYELGSADGVAGPRTTQAMVDFMAARGIVFDGTIDGVELDALGLFADNTVRVDFGVPVSELYFLDQADINNDGVPDFVVAAMSDPEAQIGLPCCNVTAEQAARVEPAAPVLVYSTPAGYRSQPFPEETFGNRTFSGRFLFSPDGTFFVLGRNGELGLPSENRGEKSVIVRLAPDVETVGIEPIYEYDIAETTAGIVVWDNDGDSYPEILQNNYGKLDTRGGDSTLRTMGAGGVPIPYQLAIELDDKKAHNFIGIEDIDGNGQLDVLAAAEVWKGPTGLTLALHPGSYVLLNGTNPGSEIDKLYLDPPFFGANHAGFGLGAVSAGSRLLLLEVSVEFLGFQHTQGNPFQGFNLDVFELKSDGQLTRVTDEVLPRVPAARSGMQNYVRTADLDFDGVREAYLAHYVDRPEYLRWAGEAFDIVSPQIQRFAQDDYENNQIYLVDQRRECFRVLTFTAWMRGQDRETDLHISACMRI